MSKTYSFLASILLCFSCVNGPSSENDKSYMVKGYLTNSSGTLSNAQIILDNSLNWTTRSDNFGYFQIENVPSGKHVLKIKNQNNTGGFSELEKELTIVDDVELKDLKLPLPLKLNEPDTISTHSVKISWVKSDAEDFYEYKLYRHISQGLDESTGKLIFVTIARSDTFFTDTLLPSNQDYYYRIFQMNEMGRIGGSNIVHAKTIKGDLIPDGGFETSKEYTNNWLLRETLESATLEITDSIKHYGKNSLHSTVLRNDASGRLEIALKKDLIVSANTKYQISAFVRVDGYRTNIDAAVIHLIQDGRMLEPLYMANLPLTQDGYVFIDWKKFSNVITTTSDTPLEIRLLINCTNIWVDDIQLLPMDQ